MLNLNSIFRVVSAGMLTMMAASVTGRAQEPTPCPATLPAGVTCYTGTGDYGAPYLIAIPDNWNGTLILNNRGGGRIPVTNPAALGAPSLLLADGYAVAAADYPDTIASEAARDSENLRQIFVRR